MAAIEIARTVDRATARLGGLHLRAAARRHLAIVLGAVAAGAVTRPFLWPLGAHPAWQAASRTAILAGGAGVLALAGILVHAWRSRPTALASARRIDAALALEEVVASGYAFEQAGRDDEVVLLARKRALAAVRGIDLRRLLRPARIDRTRLGRLILRVSIPVVLGALVFGGVDRLVVARLLRPVTADERAAAAELRKAADALAASADPQDGDDPKLAAAEAARKAAAATERGDRQAALEALDAMRKAERAAEARERAQAKELRALKDALDGKGEGATPGRSASAADAIAKLGKQKDPAEIAKVAERLAKAEAAARAAAKAASGDGKPGSGSPGTASAWQSAADALEEAREAAARGDQAAAKAALDRAEKAVRGLEKQHGGSAMQTLASASKSASSLDRSLQGGAKAPGTGNAMAGEGKDGSPQPGGKEGGNKPGGDGDPSRGGGPGDRTPGSIAAERPKVEGDLQARADVREGEKAAGVIDGMGKGGDPKDYRAIFPAYDTAVEDGLREELVPAARRPAVRRYFEAIRPDDNGAMR